MEVRPNSPQAQAVRDAERDAQTKINASRERVKQAQQDAEWEINRVRDEYVKQTEEEAARQEGSILNQKTRGYEAVREMQRQQQGEVNQVRREGERDLSHAQNYYRDTLYNTEHQGERQLEDLRVRLARENETQTRQSTQTMDFEKSKAESERQIFQGEHEARMTALQTGAQQEYDKARENTIQQTALATKQTEERYHATVAAQQKALAETHAKAADTLNEIRSDTSRKIAAYSSRQSDPFYQLLNTGAEMSENDNAYVVKLSIPEHERKNLQIAVRGNELVVSGQRRNQEKLEIAPGRSQSSSIYQAFTESFPIAWPVDQKSITRVFDGDQVTFTVPKKAVDTPHQQYKSKAIELTKGGVERPKFPDNLPIQEYTKQKAKGSSTLT